MSTTTSVAFSSFLALSVLSACGGATANDPPSPASGGLLEHGMENCPSAVHGAHTVAHDVDRGIALDITGTAPDDEAAIRAVAAIQAQMGAPSAEREMHTGNHGGPGSSGRCPIVHVGTQVVVAPIDGGVRVTVLSLDDTAVTTLRQQTRDRLAMLVLSPQR